MSDSFKLTFDPRCVPSFRFVNRCPIFVKASPGKCSLHCDRFGGVRGGRLHAIAMGDLVERLCNAVHARNKRCGATDRVEKIRNSRADV